MNILGKLIFGIEEKIKYEGTYINGQNIGSSIMSKGWKWRISALEASVYQEIHTRRKCFLINVYPRVQSSSGQTLNWKQFQVLEFSSIQEHRGLKFHSIMTNSQKVLNWSRVLQTVATAAVYTALSAAVVKHHVHNGSGPMRALHLRQLVKRVVECSFNLS